MPSPRQRFPSHLKASPNDSTSKATKSRLWSPLPRAERYEANIRFGTLLDSYPNTFITDFVIFDFLCSIELVFWARIDIVASGIFKTTQTQCEACESPY